jgi:hypothetical protein
MPRLVQGGLLGGVGRQVGDAVLLQQLGEFRLGLDHEHGDALGAQLGHRGPPDAAVGADDVMVLEVVEALAHASPPDRFLQLAGDQRPGHRIDAGGQGDDPEDDEGNREHLPGGVQWPDLAVADRGQGGHGHVERVGQAPALQQQVT